VIKMKPLKEDKPRGSFHSESFEDRLDFFHQRYMDFFPRLSW
jgi:hypothetical protein